MAWNEMHGMKWNHLLFDLSLAGLGSAAAAAATAGGDN